MSTSLNRAIAKFPIRRWLQEQTGVSGDSGRVRIDCPGCGGKRTLSVSLETTGCRCFRCADGGKHNGSWKGTGHIVHLICLLEGVDRSSAVRKVFELAGVKDDYKKPAKVDTGKDVPDNLFPLSSFDPTDQRRAALEARGLEHLVRKVHFCATGRYADRWIIPCMFMGKIVGFEAKAYKKSITPKSLFPTWFKTSQHIHTTDWDYDEDFAVITESIFDAETIGTNAVGLFGSRLNDGQVQCFSDLGVKRLVWFLDSDAWMKQATAILGKTMMLWENWVVKVPKGEDPNSLGKQNCWNLIGQAVKVEDGLDLFSIEGM